jgi:hypothetical protein
MGKLKVIAKVTMLKKLEKGWRNIVFKALSAM